MGGVSEVSASGNAAPAVGSYTNELTDTTAISDRLTVAKYENQSTNKTKAHPICGKSVSREAVGSYTSTLINASTAKERFANGSGNEHAGAGGGQILGTQSSGRGADASSVSSEATSRLVAAKYGNQSTNRNQSNTIRGESISGETSRANKSAGKTKLKHEGFKTLEDDDTRTANRHLGILASGCLHILPCFG